jgi:3-oxoacyl-[acyl-carrier-protein] synthase I
MASGAVVLVGIGMFTPIGLSAAETAASVRAGTMRFTETSLMDKRLEPFTLAEIPEEGLPLLAESLDRPGLPIRERRMLRLATAPLVECLEVLPPDRPPPPLHLGLPETETMLPLNSERFLKLVAMQTGARFQAELGSAEYYGRAGGLAAIGGAIAAILSGSAPFAVAGAIDTYRDLYVLGKLDRDKRVKSSSNLDGFVPGEGAVFLLLASADAASAAGMTPIARLTSVSTAEEPGHLYSDQPYKGEGLAALLEALLSDGLPPIQEVYASMNGESHWAKEWGVAFMRNRSAFLEDHGMHHPADCYGDLGAASGPAMVALASLGIRDGYRKSPAIVYASSDRGARAALALIPA